MTTRIRAVQKADKTINAIVAAALTVILLFAFYCIWDTWQLMNGGASGSDLTHYKPKPGEATHQSLADLKARNEDVCAWLTIDNTGIDYPVLQGKDNFEYLTQDTFGNYSMLGSLFLDYRCDPTFESCYALIHGHHMAESKMFGDLDKFEDKNFFENNKTGYLMTVDKTYELEIFACLHIEATDPYVYSTYKISEVSNRALLEHINEAALYQRDIGIKSTDKIIAMSTCASGQTSDRTVVFARMIQK